MSLARNGVPARIFLFHLVNFFQAKERRRQQGLLEKIFEEKYANLFHLNTKVIYLKRRKSLNLMNRYKFDCDCGTSSKIL